MSTLDELHDFSRWRFYPGMLFGGRSRWWGDLGNRPRPHEGIDFCFYLDNKGKERCLEQSTLLPAIYDGRVIHMGDDFLGRSIYVDTGISDASFRTLLFIYAHLHPKKEITCGRTLRRGDSIGAVSPCNGKKNAVRPHLHISAIWIPENLGTENLDWKTLVKLQQVAFCDPLPFVGDDYEICGAPL